MSRIHTPATIEAAPMASRPQLQAVQKQLGTTPNLFRVVANSPAALEGYLGMSGALARGALPAQTRERIALAVAQLNGCDYCLAAHSFLGRNLAKLSDEEIGANRGRFARPEGGCGRALCRNRRAPTRARVRCRTAGGAGRRLR